MLRVKELVHYGKQLYSWVCTVFEYIFLPTLPSHNSSSDRTSINEASTSDFANLEASLSVAGNNLVFLVIFIILSAGAPLVQMSEAVNVYLSFTANSPKLKHSLAENQHSEDEVSSIDIDEEIAKLSDNEVHFSSLLITTLVSRYPPSHYPP